MFSNQADSKNQNRCKILSFGASDWWTSIKKKFVVNKLYRVQRLAFESTEYLSASCSYQLTHNDHVFSSLIKLKEISFKKARAYSHANILSTLPKIFIQLSVPCIYFSKVYKINISSRSDRERYPVYS